MLQSSITTNSHSTYFTALNSFLSFRADYHLDSIWPIPSHHIVLFIAHSFEKGKSSATISTYVAGLNYFHKLFGFYNIYNVFMVTKLLEGCRRCRRSRDNRAPITKTALTNICSLLPQVCYDNYEVKLFHALFSLAYFGLFRVSELVVPSKTHIHRVLMLSDLSISNNQYLIVKLHFFKTNQTGKQVTLKIPRDEIAICPVRALQEYLMLRPQVQGALFIHRDGVPVTRVQFSAVLNKCVQCSSLSAKTLYKTHSFRIGRATDLAIQGLPSEAIMKMGRWSSTCYNLYIR